MRFSVSRRKLALAVSATLLLMIAAWLALHAYVRHRVAGPFRGRLTWSRFDLLPAVEARDVVLVDDKGDILVQCPRIRLEYDIWKIPGARHPFEVVRVVHVEHPRVVAKSGGEGDFMTVLREVR